MPSLILITEGFQHQVFPLGASILMIGHTEISGVPLLSNSDFRNHAAIIFGDGNYVLCDNGSATGIFVNSERISQCLLKHQDTIRFGAYIFIVDMEDSGIEPSQDPEAVPPASIQNVSATWSGYAYRQAVEFKPRTPFKTTQLAMPSAAARTPALPKVSVKQASPNMTLLLTDPIPFIQTLSPIKSKMDHARFSFICGWAGLVTLLPAIPAIIFGHLSTPASSKARTQRTIGLSLGYTALLLWFVIGLFFLKSSRPGEGPVPPQPVTSVQPSAKPPSTERPPPPVSMEPPIKPPAPIPAKPSPPIPSPAASKIPPSTSSKGSLEPPLLAITDMHPLFSRPATWTPRSEAFTFIFKGTGDINKLTFKRMAEAREKDLATVLGDFRSTWASGLVFYEPEIIHVHKSKRVIQLVIEDWNTNPTLWKRNTTVVPEKKAVIGPFYIPCLEPNLFHIQENPTLATNPNPKPENARPWFKAMRGIEWPAERLGLQWDDISRLRWIVLLKPSVQASTLELKTREGTPPNNVETAYYFDVFPSVSVMEILYLPGTNRLVAMRLNESLIINDQGKEFAKMTINAGLEKILQLRPESDLEIPLIFQMREKAPR